MEMRMSDEDGALGCLKLKEEENKATFMKEKANYFQQLQRQGQFCNCTISVGGELFKVHLEILCASSEYFDSIIRRDSDFEDVVSLHNMTPETFQSMLNYLYTGSVEINSSNIVDIYIAADFLILNAVLDRCRDFFRDNKDKDIEAGATLVSLYDDEIIFRHIIEKRNFIKKKDQLRQLGPSYFFKMLRHITRPLFIDKGIMYMGSYYIQRLQDLFSDIFPEETRKITKEDCESNLTACPRDIAMTRFLAGCMYIHDSSVDFVDETEYSPWENFPPDTWTISKMVFYILPNWGDTVGLIGGVDVEYRNIWTSERRMASSPFTDLIPSDYDRKILELEVGETVNGFTVNSGWLVDKMTFTTSYGRKLGPFGRSGGGNCASMRIPREKYSNLQQSGEKRTFLAVALHGFSFSIVRTHNCYTWYNVRFVYSGINAHLDGIRGIRN
ncbi:unnamed protein product [Rodentolepis nana]|uniref:BTB domain-containing protein n=1 Tax=Rodentolepis nana TaxID=102285 RepID=A0A0R3T8N5_RODNA|nr:unnamed protein product [Rodentolepis nana]